MRRPGTVPAAMAPLFIAAVFGLALATPLGPESWVSLATPCFALIAMERLLRGDAFVGGMHVAWALLFLAGCGVSLAAGVWSGRSGAIGTDEATLLLRFCFWISVFLLTADALSRAWWTPRLALWAAVAAAALALMRLADGFAHGGLHAEPQWLSQNAYGARFSLFMPFLAAAAIDARRERTLLWSTALLGGLAVVFLNGSRSAWITTALGLGLAALIHLLAGRLRVAPLAAVGASLLGLAVLAPLAAPQPLRAKLAARVATLSSLDSDKPLLTRRLVVEKGLRLFAAEPWTGRGLGLFSKTEVAVVTSEQAWLTDRDLNRRSAHNGYVKALAETGLAGFVPLALLLGWLALRGLPAAVRLTRRGEPWAAGAYASFAAVALHLWTLSGLTGTAPWFCFGWTAAAILRGRRLPT